MKKFISSLSQLRITSSFSKTALYGMPDFRWMKDTGFKLFSKNQDTYYQK